MGKKHCNEFRIFTNTYFAYMTTTDIWPNYYTFWVSYFGLHILEVQIDYFLNGISVKTIVFVRVYNQQFLDYTFDGL